LVGTFYIEDRMDEIQAAIKESKDSKNGPKQKGTAQSKQKSPEDMIQPVIGFDAIFIPDSIKSLGQISAMLA